MTQRRVANLLLRRRFMTIYKKSLQFKMSIWLQILGRSIVVLCLTLFILGIIYKSHIYFQIGFVMFLAVCSFGLIAFLLAIGLRCEVCHRRPSVFFRNSEARYVLKSENEIQALFNDFYPIEIRQGRFRCVHCGTEYLLK